MAQTGDYVSKLFFNVAHMEHHGRTEIFAVDLYAHRRKSGPAGG